jgi:hypothetical protein
MKLLKFMGAVFVVAIGLFLFVANFSAVETRYQCPGDISSHGNSQRTTIFMKLNKYRWWVDLWSTSNSDGDVWLEVPHRGPEYFNHIRENGDELQFFDYSYQTTLKEYKGYFSSLSKTLTVTTPSWSFEGTCKTIEE